MKVIVVHDASVYKALQKHNRFIRKTAIFSIAVTAYLIAREIQIKKIEDELNRLSNMKGE